MLSSCAAAVADGWCGEIFVFEKDRIMESKGNKWIVVLVFLYSEVVAQDGDELRTERVRHGDAQLARAAVTTFADDLRVDDAKHVKLRDNV